MSEYLAAHLTFKKAAVEFFDKKKMSDATRRGYAASLKRWDRYLADLTCVRINRQHILRFVADRQDDGVGSPAIRQDLAFLSSLLTYAQGLPNGPELNVVRNFPKRHLALPAERDRFLTREEAAVLLGKLSGERLRIVQLVLETGLRRTEVLELRTSYLNLSERNILLPREVTKTAKPRSIPLSELAVNTLRAQSEHMMDGWVFPNPKTRLPYYDANPWFPKACQEAGINDFRFHDLRHTFGSWWSQDDRNERVLAEILGHKTVQTTRRYNHLRVAHLLAAMDRGAQVAHKP